MSREWGCRLRRSVLLVQRDRFGQAKCDLSLWANGHVPGCRTKARLSVALGCSAERRFLAGAAGGAHEHTSVVAGAGDKHTLAAATLQEVARGLHRCGIT